MNTQKQKKKREDRNIDELFVVSLVSEGRVMDARHDAKFVGDHEKKNTYPNDFERI